MTALHIDFETRSELELRDVGLHRYARHPSTEPWCMAWALGEDEPQLWRREVQVDGYDEPFREGLRADAWNHVMEGGAVYAHNAPFELEIWNEIMVPRYGWPVLRPAQVYCTMAMAYAMGLPGALEDAALALGMSVLKDTEGRAIMLKFAKPWKREPTRWMDECPSFTVNGEKIDGKSALARLYEYCRQDVRVERELHKRLMPLSDTERKVWLLDYKINQRGVQIDIESAKAAITLAERTKEKCNAELACVTDGQVQAVTAVAALKEWAGTQGVEIDSLAKLEVVDLLADGVPPSVQRALVLRQEAAKASTAKFDMMVERAGDDGRLRQMYQYHGAGPGRWAGRAVQTHNLPRDMPKPEVVEKILALVREGKDDAIDTIYGPPLTMISKCLRSFFVAPPGKKLISGDWSNVEGRGQAWFAGEEWKLKAFLAADAKIGPGIYELAYSRMFGVPIESVKNPSEERQIGKVSELAFGYAGGVGSFHTMAKSYPEVSGKISDAQAEQFKQAWRSAHPKIAAVWKEIERAALNAVRHPGETYVCGHPGRQAKYKMVGSFLWCLLPSGRAICYPYPKILEGEYGPQLTYMTVPSQEDRKKGKIIADPKNSSNWARIATYGGALFNNIVQGTCRDFLADCMLRLDDAGLLIVLHTHDSVAGEVDEAKAAQSATLMERMMRQLPTWAGGFPLFAECDVDDRFRG